MSFFSSFLFAASASIDNFTVSIAYGIKKVKISLLSNILIALVSSIGTFASMSIGKLLVNFISSKLANIAGCTILILIGFWCMLSPFLQRKKDRGKKLLKCEELLDNPEKADIDKSGTIDVKESFSLALALMLNNIGFGLAASITNLNMYITSLMTFLLSLLTISFGHYLGKRFLSNAFGKYAEYVSGLIIIVLGVYQLL